MFGHKHSHSEPDGELPAAAERLRRHSRKITGPRRAILEVLCKQAHPMSIKELFAALRDQGCDLATVYRSMHVLEETGIVKRYDLGDGVARFEVLKEGEDGHHHHLVCTKCSGIVELDDCFLRDLEEQVASRNGFQGVTHKLEFFGICPACQ